MKLNHNNTCKLIKNAKNDPELDPQLNAKLCRGYDCETCPHYIKDPNTKKIDQIAIIIENLEKLKKIDPSEKWISVDEIILELKEVKEKLENILIEKRRIKI